MGRPVWREPGDIHHPVGSGHDPAPAVRTPGARHTRRVRCRPHQVRGPRVVRQARGQERGGLARRPSGRDGPRRTGPVPGAGSVRRTRRPGRDRWRRDSRVGGGWSVRRCSRVGRFRRQVRRHDRRQSQGFRVGFGARLPRPPECEGFWSPGRSPARSGQEGTRRTSDPYDGFRATRMSRSIAWSTRCRNPR